MQRMKMILALGVLGVVSSAAYAFQETKGGTAAGQSPSVGAVQATPPSLDLRDTGTSVGAPPSGVEVRIPGLGKLGVLPKFDFGLELLYGVNEQKSDVERRLDSAPLDDAQIRGSLKHRF